MNQLATQSKSVDKAISRKLKIARAVKTSLKILSLPYEIADLIQMQSNS